MKLRELQNGTGLKPILDCPTRWNSTADMLERALKLRDCLVAFSSIFDATKNASEETLSLPLNSWTNFERIFEYLLPFRQATLLICGDTYPSISMIVPLYNSLLDHLKFWMVEKSNPSEALHRSIVSANAKLSDYYNSTSDCYTISTVLDPRFKLEYYKKQEKEGDRESSNDIFEIVNAAYQKFYAPEPSVQEPEVPLNIEVNYLFKFLDDGPTVAAVDEFKTYCHESSDRLRASASDKKDVLNWWKSKSIKYPNLSKMA